MWQCCVYVCSCVPSCFIKRSILWVLNTLLIRMVWLGHFTIVVLSFLPSYPLPLFLPPSLSRCAPGRFWYNQRAWSHISSLLPWVSESISWPIGGQNWQEVLLRNTFWDVFQAFPKGEQLHTLLQFFLECRRIFGIKLNYTQTHTHAMLINDPNRKWFT